MTSEEQARAIAEQIVGEVRASLATRATYVQHAEERIAKAINEAYATGFTRGRLSGDVLVAEMRYRHEAAIRTREAETWEPANDLLAEIEAGIASDPRHFKDEIHGAHMLGSVFRDRLRARAAQPQDETT